MEIIQGDYGMDLIRATPAFLLEWMYVIPISMFVMSGLVMNHYQKKYDMITNRKLAMVVMDYAYALFFVSLITIAILFIFTNRITKDEFAIHRNPLTFGKELTLVAEPGIYFGLHSATYFSTESIRICKSQPKAVADENLKDLADECIFVKINPEKLFSATGGSKKFLISFESFNSSSSSNTTEIITEYYSKLNNPTHKIPLFTYQVDEHGEKVKSK